LTKTLFWLANAVIIVVQTEIHYVKKSLSCALLITMLVSGSILVFVVEFGVAQAPGVIVIIGSDTTWTKADSPHTLTGPIVVSTGVTLTINAGVTVNLNGYDLFVNGTLRAIGSTSDNIQISGGDITFGSNDQTGLDSAFENVVINSTISSSKPLKLNSNIINVRVNVGANSVISNNIVVAAIDTGDNATVSNNNIKGDLSVGSSSTISDNTIEGDVTTGSSAKILSNTINGSSIYFMPFGGHGYTTALTVGGLSEISNNTISGGVKASSSTISNNVISGGAPFTDWAGRPEDSTSAVTVSGDSSIISNTIFSSTGGYGVLIRAGYTYISGNIIYNQIRVAGDALIENNLLIGTGIKVGHIFVSAFNDIDYGYGNSIIRNNTITGGGVGIGSTREGGTSTIMHNLISNNSVGIAVASQMTILNNTIANSTIAIELHDSASSTISYNNIINYTQNSVRLSSVPTAVNATYNWWGTTDTQAINLTIYDYKYDFYLGKVNFVPFLTEPNPEAIPIPEFPSNFVIPEFPSWLLLPLFLVATFAVIIVRKRLVC
jgi:hypothetical protein